jgi:hypothetical protein
VQKVGVCVFLGGGVMLLALAFLSPLVQGPWAAAA